MNKLLFAFGIAIRTMNLCTGDSNNPTVPFLSGRVVDEAGILDAQTKASITQKLKEHEAKTTQQIVVYTTTSLGGGSIEDYAEKVFNEWKLGQKDKNNGVLFMIAPRERKMRIEVGYGLEGQLTDLKAAKIIRNIATPYFKKNQMSQGIDLSVDTMISVLNSEEVDFGENSSGGTKLGFKLFEKFAIVGFFSLFYLVIAFLVVPKASWLRVVAITPYLSGAYLILVKDSVFGLLLLFFGVFGFMALLALIGKILGIQGLKDRYGISISQSRRSGGSGWSSSSSGSSFSGGGGRSGGGGASGGW